MYVATSGTLKRLLRSSHPHLILTHSPCSHKNRSRLDAATYYRTLQPHPWFVVVPLDPSHDGKPVGCVVGYVHANGVGWIALLLVKAAYRGRGMGGALGEVVQTYLRQRGVQRIGLDALEHMTEKYGRRGFVETNSVTYVVRQGVKDVPAVFAEEDQVAKGLSVVGLDEVPRERLVESDRECSGLLRTTLWSPEGLFDREDVFGLALVGEQGGVGESLRGWVVVRQCHDGYRIGPLYAESKVEASTLVKETLKAIDKKDREGSVCAELFVGNRDALPVFEELEFNAVANYRRMWKQGDEPEEQRAGGKGRRCMFAGFDAAHG
ncbi:hypothetical protein BDY21DRAFT_170917 [Lineolata rhizophorae]|uniref:N-acetyltransferase domain-containing protein n=1 Tax=Lineolata rhizophorae TaxID=578093 RepID=A0A6A6P9V5_9PEZI|nr:hypothetical protein BDY21DRAFT_170917 [Lineolata rhizophorae]